MMIWLTWIGYILLWIGYFLLGILLLVVMLCFVPIKVELKVDRIEQWIEGRFLFFKYRYHLKDLLARFKKGSSSKDEESTEAGGAGEDYEHERQMFERNKSEAASSTGKRKKTGTSNQLNDVKKIKAEQGALRSELKAPKVEEESPIESIASLPSAEENEGKISPESLNTREKKGRLRFRQFKAFSAIPLFKALRAKKAFSAFQDFKAKISIPPPKAASFAKYLKFMTQFHKYREVFFRGLDVLNRILIRITVKKLDSKLEFNVDDPPLNAKIMGVFWTLEANLHAWTTRHFRKVKFHRFDIESRFAGNDIFLETSCIVSFTIADIIVAALLSFKDLMAIKNLLKKDEKQGGEVLSRFNTQAG